jgi:hypothetical protein
MVVWWLLQIKKETATIDLAMVFLMASAIKKRNCNHRSALIT